jgi:nucleoside-diphosphate-sugar epimerase
MDLSLNLLVTGANSFVCQALMPHLIAQGYKLTAQVRSSSKLKPALQDHFNKQLLQVREAAFVEIPAWLPLLTGRQAIIHCAARVHQVRETSVDPLAAYREVNTQATLALAQAAAQAQVKRFVFLSSVKVNGEFTSPGKPFTCDQAAPRDPYGVSKWEAEIGLREIAAETGMEVVIIRPPLVYGPGVKANFLTMMQWLHRGVPLPLGSIANQRSLVALPNLVDFISLCVTHPEAANHTFMISDQQDVSTTELLRGLGDALKRPARLIPVPQALLEGSLKLMGKGGMAQRLCGDLTVDSTPATELLGWKPPISVQQGLQLTADHFLATQSKSSE